MRPLLAIAGVVLFGAVAALARSPAVVPPAFARAPHYTAAPRETVEGRDPAALDPGIAPEQLDRANSARPRMVTGLVLPIEGAGVPEDPDLQPNAARGYRAGWHEGIDFAVPRGSAVLAAAAGTVARIDRDYTDLSTTDREQALADARALGYTPEATLDRIRGRQVWIDHGGGLVTRYAHLDAVAPLAVGERVERGQPVGVVGSTGYPEGGPHLHFEIRVGEGYLGDGLEGERLARVIARAFE